MQHLPHTLAALVLAAACIPATAQNDWQSRKDRENAATSAGSITRNGGRFDANAEAARAQERRNAARQLEAQQSAPSMITHCNGGACYDNMGGVYHRQGDNLTGPQGQVCTRQGPNWRC
ncbi:hypothetical protein LJR066_002852 [Acidovorax sp. LjRoot66]|uniref:hypothetical protein n=1 Tax=Acidovorax sp. LjRoot66 TaxID=3342334 RepID=UPI003ED1311F